MCMPCNPFVLRIGWHAQSETKTSKQGIVHVRIEYLIFYHYMNLNCGAIVWIAPLFLASRLSRGEVIVKTFIFIGRLYYVLSVRDVLSIYVLDRASRTFFSFFPKLYEFCGNILMNICTDVV